MNLDTDAIYTYTDKFGTYFWMTTPDGEGRMWWDTLDEAKGQTGNERVVYLVNDPTEGE